MTEICHGCGCDRQVVDAEPGWVIWYCPTCRYSREEVIEPPC
jgi:hypothetical protein